MAVPKRRGYRKWASNLDMYRKVPIDLLEGTKRGSIVSFLAMATMGILFFMETVSYLSSSTLKTDVTLDLNREAKVRINFNVTMMDLNCDYVVIDVVSQLGTEQNVTSNVQKYSLDAQGVKDRYKGRNKDQNDVILSDSLVTETLEELHSNGEDAVSLDPETLGYAREDHTYLFVDFYASWCSHCKDLAPTWEVLAEAMADAAMNKVDEQLMKDHKEYGHVHPDDVSQEEYEEAMKVELPVMIAKVDCVTHKELCFQQQIWAYPTLRLFIEGTPTADYKGDRTVLEMIHWLSAVETAHKQGIGEAEFKVKVADEIAREILDVEETKEEMTAIPARPGNGADTGAHKEWAEKMKRYRTRTNAAKVWDDKEHPGCQLSGFLWVDRVPGNFHIQARSTSHDIAAHMTNVSHEIHHLSFGEPYIKNDILSGKMKYELPKNFAKTLAPLDGNVYINQNEHEAFHHYMKVVTTQFTDPYKNVPKKTAYRRGTKPVAYQILSSSQLSFYRSDIVPEAKFSYDPSPIAVYHRSYSEKRWYDYITSIMAIIGGTFTVLGMIENTLHAAMKKRK